MILLTDLQKYCEHIVSAIDDIVDYRIFFDETHLLNEIRTINHNNLILLCIAPSSDTNAYDIDTIKESEQLLFYVVAKKDLKLFNSNVELIQYFESVQLIVRQLKELFVVDAETHSPEFSDYHFMHNFNPNKMHTDPEYNLLGFYGFSISFNLLTENF